MRELTGGFSCIMSVVFTIDYAGGSAGPTTGSHRVAVWAKRWTKSTRAFAPRREPLNVKKQINNIGYQYVDS